MKAEEIFLNAIEKNDHAERDGYLNGVCAGDDQLRREVEGLLASHDAADSFLNQPVFDATPDDIRPVIEQPGDVIGPYKLLQQIGEGGMGVVYMAEQTEPVERRVALKIIKPGMDSRQVIARFEAERQALAMMDHPNIAKVLDAGTTQAGRPYFVMELVKGIPITKYCDEQHLTPRERLELFVPICQAVQHAHQKGIIHRDLKPTNILVAQYDGKPVPKVIDFGVAKAISQKLTEKTMFTQYGQIVGTVDYMSPEQAQFNQLDVDTRSDVYSLGVLLYELLTGETPFDKQRLRSAAFDELLRIIRDEAPPRPSLKLSSSQSLPTIAANRHIEPQKLSALVRGELDWIVMKALEKDRNRRYETANAFAADVLHYLHDEPVTACPPSAAYRFRKFARRNKVAIGTTATIAASLIAGIIGTSWQAYRAITAEGIAENRLSTVSRQKDEIAEEKQRAEEQAAIAKAVKEFLNQDLLAQTNPMNEPDRDIKLRTVLDRAAEKIGKRFDDNPLVEAEVRETLADSYFALGVFEKAEKHYKRTFEIQRRLLGTEHRDTLWTAGRLAQIYSASRRLDEAETLLQQTLDTCRRVLGSDDPLTLLSMGGLADVFRQQNRYDEAETLFRKVLEKQRRVHGVNHIITFSTMHALALTVRQDGRYGEAEKLFTELLQATRETFGDEHEITLAAMEGLAGTKGFFGDFDGAAILSRQVLETRRRVLGPEHPITLNTMRELAEDLLGLERYQESENLLREALEKFQRTLGTEDPWTITCMTKLGAVLGLQGKDSEAEKVLLETLELQKKVRAPDRVLTLAMMGNLANAIADQGRNAEAEKLYRETLEMSQRILGAEHPETVVNQTNLAIFLLGQGADEVEEAELLFRESLETTRRVLGSEHPKMIDMLLNLATCVRQQGNDIEPEKLHREAVNVATRVLGAEHPRTLVIRCDLGVDYARQGQYAKAEEVFREVLPIQQRVLGSDDLDTTRCMHNLATVIKAQSRFDEAIKIYRQVLEIRSRKLGPDHPLTHATMNSLADTIARQESVQEEIKNAPKKENVKHSEQLMKLRNDRHSEHREAFRT